MIMERFGAILNPDPRVPVPSAKRGVVRAVYQYSVLKVVLLLLVLLEIAVQEGSFLIIKMNQSGCEFENAYETRGPKGGIKTLSGTRRRL